MTLDTLSIQHAKMVCKGSFIDDDLGLFDKVTDLPLPMEPKRMTCQMLALCTHGSVEYNVDTVRYRVGAGDIIIVNDGQVVDNCHISDDCEGIVLLVSDNYFNEVVSGVRELSSLFVFSRSHPVFHLVPSQVETVFHYFKILKDRVSDVNNHFRRDVARSLIQAGIYDVSNVIWSIRQEESPTAHRADSIFREFISLVEENFRHERRVGWYAHRMCITPKYLSETIRTVSRRTPNEWIDYYVVMELRVMLRNTSRAVKEIAEEMHFANQSFLGKYFKDHVGMSPTDYRKGLNKHTDQGSV